MKLWTIQTADVLATLQATGVWRASETHVDVDWLDAYRWLAGRMTTHLGNSTLPNQMPTWVWQRWDGIRRPRPDLRSRGHLPLGTQGVRLELEITDDRVLLSDFELWHYVLNYSYLPSSVRDGKAFDCELESARLRRTTIKLLPNSAWHARVEKSWERIFDVAWVYLTYTARRAEKMIQGTVWELRLSDIRDVTQFVGR